MTQPNEEVLRESNKNSEEYMKMALHKLICEVLNDCEQTSEIVDKVFDFFPRQCEEMRKEIKVLWNKIDIYNHQIDRLTAELAKANKELEMVREITVETLEKVITEHLRGVPVFGQINTCNALYANEGAINKLSQAIHALINQKGDK